MGGIDEREQECEFRLGNYLIADTFPVLLGSLNSVDTEDLIVLRFRDLHLFINNLDTRNDRAYAVKSVTVYACCHESMI